VHRSAGRAASERAAAREAARAATAATPSLIAAGTIAWFASAYGTTVRASRSA
jgi:hypothetical protein